MIKICNLETLKNWGGATTSMLIAWTWEGFDNYGYIPNFFVPCSYTLLQKTCISAIKRLSTTHYRGASNWYMYITNVENYFQSMLAFSL